MEPLPASVWPPEAPEFISKGCSRGSRQAEGPCRFALQLGRRLLHDLQRNVTKKPELNGGS